MNTRRVTTFLNEQSDERVTLVKDSLRGQKKTYQVVPPQVKTIPGDRHRNTATINRNKLRRLSAKAVSAPSRRATPAAKVRALVMN